MTKQLAGSACKVRFAGFQQLLIAALCAVAFASLSSQRSLAQQLSYYDFNAPQAAPGQSSTNCGSIVGGPAASGVLLCLNFEAGGVNGISFISDNYPPSIDPNASTDGDTGSTNYALQLTQNAGSQTSSVWYSTPQNVAGGFTVWYAVKINPAILLGTNNFTADGFAFVIQNASGGQKDTLANCQAASGSGTSALGGGGGCIGYGGIDNSIALEMDTFWDSQYDPYDYVTYFPYDAYVDNHMALQGCGAGNPNSPAHYVGGNTSEPTSCLVMLNGAGALASNPNTSAAPPAAASTVILADDNPHQVVIVYNGPNESPANYIYVYLDPAFNPGTHTPVAGSVPLFSGPFDITHYINLNNGTATIGFTAANGGDYEQHELMGFTFTPHNYGNANVCPQGQSSPAPCSVNMPVTFTMASTTTIGSVQVVTQGANNLDFQLGSGNTCTGAISAGNSCTVNVTFAPLASGLRLGAVELFSGGNLVATQPIYGIGQGPAAALFSPTSANAVYGGPNVLSNPQGVAVDAGGNVYIADTGDSQVLEVSGINGNSPTYQQLGTGFNSPQGVAVDGAGNVFVADSHAGGFGTLFEVPAGCTSSACQATCSGNACQKAVYTVAGPRPGPVSVTVDGLGDVFFADNPNGVYEIPAGGTATPVYKPGGASQPTGVAVDAAGDLYISDLGLQQVIEIPAGCIANGSCQTTIGSGWNEPEGLTVDAAGDVYVADMGLDSGGGEIVEVPAGCISANCQVVVVSGIPAYGVALDAQGNIYLPQYTSPGYLVEASQQGLSLGFPNLDVGTASTAQSLTFQNIGNQALNAVSPGLAFTDPDFGQAFGQTPLTDCNATFSLVPGGTCDISIGFAPLSGSVNGTLLTGNTVFTDNSLNAASVSQSISLSGTGFGQAPPPSYALTVSTAGTGSGTVSGTNCSTGSYAPGTSVTCTETPSGGSQFTGWSGGTCSGTGSCSFSLNSTANVVANFSSSYSLTVTEVGTGAGTVTSNSSASPAINCAISSGSVTGTCSESDPSGTQVTLTANPTGNSIFAGWGGDCASAGASTTCLLTTNSSLNPTASFVAPGPAQSPLAPITAGVVYGQGGSFTSGTPLNGGPSVDGGLHDPDGLAFDSSGNLYLADQLTGHVLFFPAGSTTATRVYGGLNYPQGVALDASGNLYVADTYNNRVLFYPAGSTTPTRVYGQGGSFTTTTHNTGGISANSLFAPAGVAVDAGGNLYISDEYNNRILFYPAGSTTATRVYGQNGSFTSNTANLGGVSANSLVYPSGIALDASGDLYVADSINNRALFYPAGSTTATRVYGQGGSFTSNTSDLGGVSANSLSGPEGVTVDSSGNVYVADYYNARVLFYPFGSTTATRVYGQGGSLTSNAANLGGISANSMGDPYAVALDPSGSLYVADLTNNRVLEYGPFGNVNVCPSGQSTPAPCSGTYTLSYAASTSTNIGATQAVTQGFTGLDFSLASGGTCSGAISAGSSCIVNVNFTPLAPGLRPGAASLYDNSGNLLATTPIYGVGQAPEAAFGPGTQSIVAGGMAAPREIALDGAGDIFVAQNLSNQVVEIPAGGGAPRSVGSALNGPYGVAVDGAGDVFIADTGNNRVVKLPAGGGPQATVASGLNFPLGVTTDGAGDLFIADTNNNQVLELPAGGGTQITVASGLNNPNTVVADSAGDLFIVDSNSQMVEIPAGCASSACWTTVGFNLSNPRGAAVDAAGDVFIANTYASQVIEIPAGCTMAACETTVGSGFGYPWGLAVDAGGDVFVTDTNDGELSEINRSLPPSLSFALTAVNNTSVDSPNLISLQNVGNQPLTGTLALTLGTNFTENANSTCGSGFSLNPGASCYESFSFMPQSTGLLSGAADFSDNTLNLTPYVVLQAVNLSGTSSASGLAGGVVPNVVGMTQSAATAALTNAGLTLGTVSTQYSDSQPAGSVIGENPAAGSQVNLGTPVALVTSVGVAPTPAPNPLSLLNNYFVTGDYAAAGVTLRGTGQNGMATGTITIPDTTTTPPASQSVPDGADIIDGYLYWETLENTPSPSGNTGTFDGYAITGQQIGSDLPFTDGGLNGTLRVYRADVNTYFPVGANGVRFGSGKFTVSLPDSGGSGLPLTEGASLVVIYRVLSPNFPLKSIVIYDGSAIPTASTSQNMQGFYDAFGGSGSGENTALYYAPGPSNAAGTWNNSFSSVSPAAHASQYSAPLNANSAYGAVIFSTPVTNSDNDGILDAWKSGPAAGDFFTGQPGYYDVKTQSWVPLPGAQHGQKDLFVQLDYMCGAVLASGACDPSQENLFPSPDAQGNDPLAIVRNSFAAIGIVLHLEIGNAVPESTCTDNTSANPPQLCEFPGQPGVVDWKNSLEISKVWPRNFASCAAGGDCTARFPYGQKDSYHYVLFGHSLAIPAWNTPYGTLTGISTNSPSTGLTTITTADRGPEGTINYCPSRFTISGVQGSPSLNGIYNTSSCPDSQTIILSTPGVSSWSYPNNTLPEPEIGLTSGIVTSISGYSDLGGQDSAVTLGLWETAQNQNMARRANVIAGTFFHEVGHTVGLTHGGRYYDTAGSYIPTYEANCKPNFQSVMNYLFQLDGVGPNASVAFSNQTLATLLPGSLGSVTQLITDGSGNPATFPTSSWYTSTEPSTGESPATFHCDGTPLTGDTGYRINASIAPIPTADAWSTGQNITFDSITNNDGVPYIDGVPYTKLRGYNDVANIDLRQVGATGGEFASLASVLSFAYATTPVNIPPGGTVTLGTGGTVALGSGGTVTLGSGGNVTLSSAGTIALGSGGSVTLNNGGNVTLPASGGTIALGSGGTVALGSGGTVTLSSGGTIALGSGGTVALGSGGTVTLGSGGTIALGSGGTVTIPSSGGSYTLPDSGGTITLGSGGTVALGSGGTVALGSGGTIALGSGGTVALGSGGTVALGSGGTVTLGSGGTIALGSGGNVTLSSGGTIALGSGGTVALGSGGTVALGSGGTVALGSGGNVTIGSGGTATLGSGGTVALGSGGTIALGSGGSITLSSGGTIALGSGGTVTLGSGGTIALGSGGTIALGSGGNLTLSGGGTIALGSGGTVALGSGGTVALGSGGVVALGSGGTIALGSGGTVALGSGGTIALGSGGTVALGSGGAVTNELDYDTANSFVRPPVAPSETPVTTQIGQQQQEEVVVNWTAPAFGVVQTYTISRSVLDSNGNVVVSPTVIGSVSGIIPNPPATTFTDTNPPTPPTGGSVVYTITTTLVPDTNNSPPRSSAPSPPAVLKNNQTIVLGSLPSPGAFQSFGNLPSSVPISNSPLTIAAIAETNNGANYLQVSFSASGDCSVGNPSIDPTTGISSASVALNNTGSCTITASQAGSSSYISADPVSGTFTILPKGSNLRSQTISFGPLPNVQYGGTFPLSATASSGQTVMFSASGPCTTSGTTTGVGLCTITASAPGNNTYSAASASQPFSVLPAVIKVTALGQTITYGQPIPALTYSLSGYVNGDATVMPPVVSGVPALSTTANSNSGAGQYPITVATGTLTAANYDFLFVPGTLTINTAGSSTAAANATTSYSPSSQIVALSATVTSTAGTVNGGTVTFTLLNSGTPVGSATTSGTVSSGAASVNYTLPAGTQAGTYTIQAVYNGSTDFAGSSDNSHTLMVNAVTATVQLNNLTQTYTGSPISATAATTPSGLTVNITYSGSTTAPTKAGSYSVVATVQSADYTGSATGTLQINQATPTVTWATPAAITYGTALGAGQLDAAATFNSALLAGTLVYTPAASAVLPAGTQTLSVTFNPNDSTDFKAVTKTVQLAVNKAVLTVTANNVSRAYGLANPTLTVGYSGFVNGDTSAKVPTGSPMVTTTAVASSLPGSYPITVSLGTLVAANYTFTFINGTLKVTFTGSVPPSGTACNGAYTGTFQGNLTVVSGQSCVLVGGGATGNITETGGNLVLSSATVGGNVTVNGGGTFSIGPSTSIKGNLQIQSIPSGSATNQVCGSTISGNLQFQSNGTSVLIGSGSPSCAGNVIKGSLQVLSNTAPITLYGNTVSVSLQVQSNTAAVTIDGNAVSGSLQVQSNTGATTLDGNTVSGSLQDQSNTGATQVISNVITGTLQCSSNTSITGSGNTAASKQGQCAKF